MVGRPEHTQQDLPSIVLVGLTALQTSAATSLRLGAEPTKPRLQHFRGAILTGPRLQGQDQDQGADHQVQAVEGPLPVSVLLVGVHQGDGEEQQELHGQLSGWRRQDGVGRETGSGLAAPGAQFLMNAAVAAGAGPRAWAPKTPVHPGAPGTTPACSLLALQDGRSNIKVLAGPRAFWGRGEGICFPGCPSSERLPAFLGPTSP